MATQLIARVASDYITEESDMLLTPPDGDPRTAQEYTYDMTRAGQAYTTPATELPAHLQALGVQIDAEADYDTKKQLIFRMIEQALGDEPSAAPLRTLRTQIDALRDQLDATQDYTTRYQLLGQCNALIKVEDAAPEIDRDDLLIGHIDNVPVLASYGDEDDILYSAKIVWQGIRVCTDGTGYINLPHDGLGCVGDVHVHDWQVLTQANVIDRLVALAQRYQRLQDVPTVPPVACPVTLPVTLPTIQVERHVCDDTISPQHGQEIGTTFSCGEVEVYFPDEKGGFNYPVLLPTNSLVDDTIEIESFDLKYAEHFMEIARKVAALLADPRVQALRAGAPVVQPMTTLDMPAVTTNRYTPAKDVDDNYDFAPGTEYHCGDVFIEVSDDPGEEPTVYGIGGDCISLAEAQQAVQAFQTLLADPRVQALCRGEVPDAEPRQSAPSGAGYQQGYDDGIAYALSLLESQLTARKAAA